MFFHSCYEKSKVLYYILWLNVMILRYPIALLEISTFRGQTYCSVLKLNMQFLPNKISVYTKSSGFAHRTLILTP